MQPLIVYNQEEVGEGDKERSRYDKENQPAKIESVLRNLGAHYGEEKDWTRAAHCFRRCIKEFPDTPVQVYYSLIDCHVSRI